MTAYVIPRGGDEVVSEATVGIWLFPSSTALAGGGYVTTWLENGDNSLHARLFASDGTAKGDEFQIAPEMAGDQVYPVVTALPDGGFVIGWDTTSQVFLQRYDAAGLVAGDVVLAGYVDYYASENPPAITTLADGSYAIAWSNNGNMEVSTYSAAGDLVRHLVLDGGGFENQPSLVSTASGGFAMLWTDQSDRNGDPDLGILRQMFDETGAAVGKFSIVNGDRAGQQGFTDTKAFSAGGFVAVWTQFGPDDGGGIRAQRFDDAGHKVGHQIDVSSLTPGNQSNASVETLSWGGFVVAWEDDTYVDGDAETPTLRLQLFDADGTKLGDEIQANASRTGDEQTPDLVALSDTSLMVTWAETYDSHGPTGILQRLLELPVLGTGGADRLVADSDGSVLLGRDGDDVLLGRAGADLLIGGAGADRMVGGAGDDHYVVDTAADRVNEARGGGVDLVESSVDYHLGANVETLVLTGKAIEGVGNDTANTIIGNNARNVLVGGHGQDALTGGLGADRFEFAIGDSASRIARADTVTDFDQVQRDRIALTGPADAPFSFIGSAAFDGGAGEVRFYHAGVDTIVAVDMDGDRHSDMSIRISGQLTLRAEDFVFATADATEPAAAAPWHGFMAMPLPHHFDIGHVPALV